MGHMGLIWGSYFNIPKAIFYLLKENYRLTTEDGIRRCPKALQRPIGVMYVEPIGSIWELDFSIGLKHRAGADQPFQPFQLG